MGQQPGKVDAATVYIAAELRAQKGRLEWSFEEIGRQAGVPKNSVANALSGKRAITAETLIALSTAMGIDPGQLISEAAERTRVE